MPGTPLLPASWLPFRLVTPVPLTVSEYLPVFLSFFVVVRVTVMVAGSYTADLILTGVSLGVGMRAILDEKERIIGQAFRHSTG